MHSSTGSARPWAEKTYCESGSSTAWHMTVGGTGGLDVEIDGLLEVHHRVGHET